MVAPFFSECVSHCECVLCQHGLDCKYVALQPFYPTLGGPQVYFAQVSKGKVRKQQQVKKPNFFVRAFRWYTEEHRVGCKPSHGQTAVKAEDQEGSGMNEDQNKGKDDMTGFATWLDMKYQQFLQQRPDTNICCVKRTETPSSIVCEHVAYQCEPSSTAGGIKKRFSKFTRCKGRSRSADGCCPRDGLTDVPDRTEAISMEYILEPKNLSRAASLCCRPTPTTTSSPYTCKGLAKCQSMTTASTCKTDDELHPQKFDKPPVEQKSYVVQSPADKIYRSVKSPKSGSKTRVSSKELSNKNAICQCNVGPPNSDAETQYSHELVHSCCSPLSVEHREKDLKDEDHVNKKWSRNPSLQDPLPGENSTSPSISRPIKTPKTRSPSKERSNKDVICECNVGPQNSNVETQYSEPGCKPLPLEQHKKYVDGKEHINRKSSLNASLQKPLSGQRSPRPSFQQPCPGVLEPWTRGQCSTFNTPCPSYKAASKQSSVCLNVQQPCSDRGPCPGLKETCSMSPPEISQQPLLKWKGVQESRMNLKQPVNPCPTSDAPCQSLHKPMTAELTAPCPSFLEPNPGMRPCPTFKETVIATEISSSSSSENVASQTDLVRAAKPCTKCQGTQAWDNEEACPSFKKLPSDSRSSNPSFKRNQNDDESRIMFYETSCVCRNGITIQEGSRKEICLMCHCNQCHDTCIPTGAVGAELCKNLPLTTSKQMTRTSLAQQTSRDGKGVAVYPVTSCVHKESKGVDTRPRVNLECQTSNNHICLDNKTMGQAYPIFMKVICADKIKCG